MIAAARVARLESQLQQQKSSNAQAGHEEETGRLQQEVAGLESQLQLQQEALDAQTDHEQQVTELQR